ncbi:hypothetical protein ACE14D_01585 [Streptomyces sp. Act-28]
MRKRNIGAIVGTAVAGTVMALSFHGSAGAAAAVPAAEQVTQEHTNGSVVDRPEAIASLAGKAYVHGKAATGAVTDAMDNFSLGSLFAAPADIDNGVDSSTAFDR